MLHITNGDSAAETMRRAGIEGELIAWRDVLHEGPVPAGLPLDELRDVRVRFISDQGWGALEEVRRDFAERDSALAAFRDHEEVVLWFEHDLYDQLQLIQLLDWFSARNLNGTRLSHILPNDYLGSMTPERLRELFPDRDETTTEELDLGCAAWQAFRSPDPTAIANLVRAGTTTLPFLNAALVRHLQQFPSVTNGLSRSELQALDAIAEGNKTVSEAYRASHHEREESIFLGDRIFASYLEGLSAVPQPLVTNDEGAPVRFPRNSKEIPGFWSGRVKLTKQGEAVRNGEADQIKLNGIDRWLGGVHLQGNESAWRWDWVSRSLRRRT